MQSNKNWKKKRQKEQLHGNFLHIFSINMKQLETMEIPCELLDVN